MELSRKTSVLLPPDLHARVTSLARRHGIDVGQLIRQAVEAQHGLVDVADRVEAVRALSALSLPVGTPEDMKAESSPFSDDPVP